MLSIQEVRNLATLPRSKYVQRTLFQVDAHQWTQIREGQDPFREIRRNWSPNDRLMMIDEDRDIEPSIRRQLPLVDYDLYLVINHVAYFNSNAFGVKNYRTVSLYAFSKEIKTKIWLKRVTQIFSDPKVASGQPFVIYYRYDDIGPFSGHGVYQDLNQKSTPLLKPIVDYDPNTQQSDQLGTETLEHFYWSVEDFKAGKLPAGITLDYLVGAYTAVKTNW